MQLLCLTYGGCSDLATGSWRVEIGSRWTGHVREQRTHMGGKTRTVNSKGGLSSSVLNCNVVSLIENNQEAIFFTRTFNTYAGWITANVKYHTLACIEATTCGHFDYSFHCFYIFAIGGKFVLLATKTTSSNISLPIRTFHFMIARFLATRSFAHLLMLNQASNYHSLFNYGLCVSINILSEGVQEWSIDLTLLRISHCVENGCPLQYSVFGASSRAIQCVLFCLSQYFSTSMLPWTPKATEEVCCTVHLAFHVNNLSKFNVVKNLWPWWLLQWHVSKNSNVLLWATKKDLLLSGFLLKIYEENTDNCYQIFFLEFKEEILFSLI